jgi:hypothetical protein
MSTMQLHPVETCLFGPFYTLLIFLLRDGDVLDCHFSGCRVVDAGHVSDGLATSYCRGTDGMMALHLVSVRHTPAMNQLNKYFTSFGMHCLRNSLPSFHLLLSIQTSIACKTSSLQTPSSRLSKYKSCSRSLRIILDEQIVWDRVAGLASLPGESSHDDSVVEGEVSHC